MRKKKKRKTLIVLFVTLAVMFVSLLGLYCYFRILYPMKYQDLISKYAEGYQLDPYFVSAVIWKESRFQEDVVSSAGAIGLMQVMPETGRWISEKIGLENYSDALLTDPECNIQLGCWYLNYLTDVFQGDLTKILAGYNAGPNRVRTWLEDPEYSSDGTTLEKIPFVETENYVQKVQQSYKIYRLLYKF